MTKQMSYSAREKEFMHILRDRINHSEDPVDLGNHFSSTVMEMIGTIDGEMVRMINPDDITFSTADTRHFSLSPHLRAQDRFMSMWSNSDLESIVERFADCTYHHYRHLTGHPEKTQKKIRGVVQG